MPITPGTVRAIQTQGAPVLTEVSHPVALDDPTLGPLMADLAATLSDFRSRVGFGRAISAPQIGVSKRVIVCDFGAGPFAVLNPEITWRSDATQTVWDDCLSVPDLLVRVDRAERVGLRYTDELGRTRLWRDLRPDHAELIQHEIDHLDGVLMIERAVDGDAIAPMEQRAALVGEGGGRSSLTAASVTDALPHVDLRFRGTPLVEFPALSEAVGTRVSVKVETLNPIRCFKGRGASAFVAEHATTSPDRPLMAASAGNWGQALALACRDHGLDLRVYAATTANPDKLGAMERLGATVVRHGADFDAAKTEARRAAEEAGARLAEDGADDIVAAGHGSLAVELTQHADRVGDTIDAVLVPLGNGALLNGVGAWLKAASPATEVVGVAAAGAPAMHESFATGEVVCTETVDTGADGLAVRVPIPRAVQQMDETTDDTVVVTDDHMREAQRLLADHAGCLVELSGAAGLAAVIADPQRWQDRHCVVVATGSNTDPRAT